MPRAPKKCGHRDCEQRSTTTYCPTHTALHAKRANTTQRGYGAEHQKLARIAKQTMPDGTPCCRCQQPMRREQRLTLDHDDNRALYRGLAHKHCNDVAGGMRSHTAIARHPG